MALHLVAKGEGVEVRGWTVERWCGGAHQPNDSNVHLCPPLSSAVFTSFRAGAALVLAPRDLLPQSLLGLLRSGLSFFVSPRFLPPFAPQAAGFSGRLFQALLTLGGLSEKVDAGPFFF